MSLLAKLFKKGIVEEFKVQGSSRGDLLLNDLLMVAANNLWSQEHGNWHQSDGGLCVQADAGES